MIPLTPLQSWAMVALAFLIVWLYSEILQRLSLVMDYGPADDEELDVNPYDRDLDPFGYIDEETDRFRDQQLLDDDLEARHG
ncbi:hypothetical protein [Pseudoclavibacter sp. AY1H1]|uniref:hypothetical protein n=1 Tax=Pseudoclavibacter sp. AY1H1 TaxID=2080584 RepID=UPI000CE73599|nr:hypothetical protein [Pseudoclavibacter sp. AY1H1]PPF38375.1 hypothetical protein C5E05_05010 [Pseudoclavibacter sp. AY1H1]